MADVKKRIDDLLDELGRVYEEKMLLEMERDELLRELGRPVEAKS